MKFYIITPTYKRPKELKKCIESVLKQKYINWEMLVINDSPDHDYTEVKEVIEKNTKIKYFINKENMGVNFSRNFALKEILNSKKVDQNNYIIFVDDDDWLSTTALFDISIFLKKYKSKNNNTLNWLITNLIYENGELITKSHIKEGFFSYFWDYLVLKKFKGDSTHVINTNIIKKINFSEIIKNGEEWLFFIKIKEKPYYKDINIKITNGYNESGLTANFKKTYINNTKKIFFEVNEIKIFFIFILRSINVVKIYLKDIIKNIIK